ncbi:PIG-U-domain-containing protein [Coemansia reversa NRRL 1564]|uniref:PIG-U-domain-containing protein n=1 Tax=Coemansia reversa (strain ATCC 12441 / NRRL 1564) TaxID=763665 RepID=A0A2G5B6U2_COERN|nr:PIG-U-domain-containing protein [Coemansia reversa NRRL 1564]|eukprot:PIA14763.1 PIG-U-domain-containing protein [Coemansia reversa NRRL 1564]
MSPKTQARHSQKSGASVAQPAQTEATRLAYVLMIASTVRLTAFVLFPGLVSTYLSGRVELSTPVTSYKRLMEGLHLSAHAVSPYDGGVFHQSPLLLLLFKPLYYLPSIFTDLLYTAADVLVALMLAKLAALKAKSALHLSVPGETRFVCMPSVVAMLYLFNPLTLGTTLVKSTIVFSHLAVVGSLYFGLQGRTNRAIVCAAVATHLSLYPAMLIVPISLMAHNRQQRFGSIMATVVKFIVAVGLLHVLFVTVFGSEYFGATIDFTVRVADLQPNVGLFWYFFTEVFDEFRLFFFVVFQLTALGFAVPVSWRFRQDPLFAATFLVGIISALKSYPAWGDLALFLGLLPIFEELLKYLQFIFLSANLLFYGVALAPVFWYLWIEQGSGNANFFYAATLVYVFGQITLLFDLGTAKLRRDLDIQRPEMRTRTVIQE